MNTISCYGCEGFGHIKVECPTFLKKQKKGLSITWSGLDDEREGEITNKIMTLIGKYKYGSESSDEDISEEELVATYRLLYAK